MGTIIGTTFAAWNAVDLAMCMSGESVALVYFRAYPLPIIGLIKNFMACLLPFIFFDIYSKIAAFVKEQTALTSVGLLNAFAFVVLFTLIPLKVLPAEMAAQEPLTLKGKALVAAEDKIYSDLYEATSYMMVLNLVLLILPIVQLYMKAETPKQKAK